MVRSVESPRTKLQTLRAALKPSVKQVKFDPLLVKSTPSPRPFRDSLASKDRNNNRPRARNAAIDLVGVETNPGPNPRRIGPQTQAQATRAAKKNSRKKAKKSAKRSSRPFMSRGANAPLSSVASQYLATVLAPCSGNARIPDFNCMPTFLASVEEELSLTANVNGVLGLQVGIGAIRSASNNTYTFENASSTDAVFAYSVSSSIVGIDTLSTNVSATRLVSACLDVTYLGTSNQDSGMVVGASYAGFSTGIAEALPASFSALSAGRVSTTNRTRDGCTITYRPVDSSSFDFRTPLSTTARQAYLIMHATGLPVGVAMRVKVRQNFECLGYTDSLDLTTGSVRSPVDPTGLAVAVSEAQGYPQVVPRATGASLTTHLRSAFDLAKDWGPTIWQASKAIVSKMPTLL